MINIDYVKISAIIGGILTLITTYFSKENNKYAKLKDEYFKELLIPYVSNYQMNRYINPVKYIKKRYSYSNYYIPTYIFYLIEEDEKDKLHKVLIEDYKELFPSKLNSYSHTFIKISNLIEILSVFLYFGVVSYIAFLIFNEFNKILINNKFNVDLFNFILALLILILFISSLIFLLFIEYKFVGLANINMDDKYTTKLKYINKQVKYKVKKYDNRKDKEYVVWNFY